MLIEEIIKQIEELNLTDKNFNYIYTGLNNDDIFKIKESISNLKLKYNKNAIEKGLFNSKNIEYKTIIIDFKTTPFKNFFNEILRQLSIEIKIDNCEYKNYLKFLKTLINKQIGIQLHLFNVNNLTEKEQLELKNIYLIYSQNLITYTYFEQDTFYNNYFTEFGKVLDYRENIQVIKRLNIQYQLKRNDIHE